MSILVTGATGFIGSRLAQALAERGEHVHLLVRSASAVRGHRCVRTFTGDIRDALSVKNAMTGCDRVFHLAAYAKNWAKDPCTFEAVNVGGLRNLLDAAQQLSVRKIVFTSSSVTIGPSNGVPASEDIPREAPPFTEYERSKIGAERLVREYVAEGANIVTVNPTRVFGPGLLNEANSVTRMIQQYLNGTWRVVPGDGSGQGNYAFVNDVVNGHLRAMDHGKSGERYLLGGENASYNDFFSLLARVSGKRYRMLHIPSAIAMGVSRLEEFRAEHFNHYPLITPGWVKTFIADWAFSTEKAERELGYTVTPLHAALRRTVAWLRNFDGEEEHQ